MGNGLFLVIEGGDGSGKTTQVELVAAQLRQDFPGRSVQVIQEPGSTVLGVALRQLLVTTAVDITPRAMTLLFNSARAQVVEEVVRPALEAGDIVVSDRWLWSTIAYQGLLAGVPLVELNKVNAFAVEGVRPDLSVLMDLPPEETYYRIREQQVDRFTPTDRRDEVQVARYALVREAYRQVRSYYPWGWLEVDATQSPEVICEMICNRVRELLAKSY